MAIAIAIAVASLAVCWRVMLYHALISLYIYLSHGYMFAAWVPCPRGASSWAPLGEACCLRRSLLRRREISLWKALSFKLKKKLGGSAGSSLWKALSFKLKKNLGTVQGVVYREKPQTAKERGVALCFAERKLKRAIRAFRTLLFVGVYDPSAAAVSGACSFAHVCERRSRAVGGYRLYFIFYGG